MTISEQGYKPISHGHAYPEHICASCGDTATLFIWSGTWPILLCFLQGLPVLVPGNFGAAFLRLGQKTVLEAF